MKQRNLLDKTPLAQSLNVELARIAGAKGGSGGSSSRQAIEAPDTLRSVAYAHILDLVSEGEIKGFAHGPGELLKDIYLGETPVMNADGSLNFKNVHVDSRLGTQDQNYIQGFPAVENETGVGVELKNVTPYTRSFTNLSLSGCRIRMSVPQLSYTNTTNGDITGTTVSYAIDLAVDGGAFVQVFIGAVTGKASSTFERDHRIDFPPAATSGWVVRVRRLTADNATAYLLNKTYIQAITEIIDGKFRYPMSALIGITFDASQFQSVPGRLYDLYGRIVKVPVNYNPETRVYTGVWDGTFKNAWTDNPAWIYYDLVSHKRYGLGHLVDEAYIDKYALYSIGRYCDEMVPNGFGGTEPRFTCNMQLQVNQDAYKTITDFASVFRGIAYWSQGAVVASADRPMDPVYTYTNANVVNGHFNYEGSARRARHSAVIVSYNDPNDFHRLKSDYYPDHESIARYGFNQVEIVAFASSSRGQAQRVAKHLLYSERLLTNTVQFSVGMDGTYAIPGQIVRVADQFRAGVRQGGRIAAATTSVITIDAMPTPVIAIGNTLTVMLPTGVSATSTVSAVNAGLKQITVSPAYSAAPSAQAVWTVETPALQNQLFKILSVAENDDGSYAIHALEHNPSIFDAVDFGEPIEVADITNFPNPFQTPVDSVTITSTPRAGNVIASTLLTASWPVEPGAVKYIVQWRKDDGEWTPPQTVTGRTCDFENAFPGSYKARVVAVNAILSKSVPTASTVLTVPDQTLTPGFVATLNAAIANALLTAQNAQATADGEIVTFFQITPPVIGAGVGQAKPGDIWFDTDDSNKIYRAVSGLWVYSPGDAIGLAILAAAGAQATADGKIKSFFQNTAPTATAIGDVWFNTDTQQTYRWDGATWNQKIGDITTAVTQVQVFNPGWEQGLLGWTTVVGTLSGWSIQTGGITGSQMLRKSGGTTGASGLLQDDIDGRRLTVGPDSRCAVQLAIKSTSTPAGNVEIGVAFYDSAGTLISNSSATTNTGTISYLNCNTFWRTFRKVVTAPANSAYAKMCFVVHGYVAGTWEFDNASLTAEAMSIDELPDGTTFGKIQKQQLQGGFMPPYAYGDELVLNGSFEQILGGGSATQTSTTGAVMADGWNIRQTNGTMPPLCSVEYNNVYRTGLRVQRMNSAVGAYPASSVQYSIVQMINTLPVVGGETFAVRCAIAEYYTTGAFPAGITDRIVFAGLRFYDANNTFIVDRGILFSGLTRNIGTDLAGRFEATATAPMNAAYAAVAMYQLFSVSGAGATAPANMSDVRFDDFSIKRISAKEMGANMLSDSEYAKGVGGGASPWINTSGTTGPTETLGSVWVFPAVNAANTANYHYQMVTNILAGIKYSLSANFSWTAANPLACLGLVVNWYDASDVLVSQVFSRTVDPTGPSTRRGGTPAAISGERGRLTWNGLVAPAGAVKVGAHVEFIGPYTNLAISKPKLEQGLIATEYVASVEIAHGQQVTTRGSRRLLGGPRNMPVSQTMGAGSVRNVGALSANSSGQVTVNAHSNNLNGETVSYNAVTNAVTGLTVNVTYVIYCFDPYGDGGTRTWYAATSVLNAQAAGDGVVIGGNITIPAAGSSTGGGGGAGDPDDWCVDYETAQLDDGRFVRDLVAGVDVVECWDGNVTNPGVKLMPLRAMRYGMEECYEVVTEGGSTIVQSKSTMMDLPDGRALPTDKMIGQKMLTRDLKWEVVVDLRYLGNRMVCKPDLEDSMFFARSRYDRPSLATHNIRYKP